MAQAVSATCGLQFSHILQAHVATSGLPEAFLHTACPHSDPVAMQYFIKVNSDAGPNAFILEQIDDTHMMIKPERYQFLQEKLDELLVCMFQPPALFASCPLYVRILCVCARLHKWTFPPIPKLLRAFEYRCADTDSQLRLNSNGQYRHPRFTYEHLITNRSMHSRSFQMAWLLAFGGNQPLVVKRMCWSGAVEGCSEPWFPSSAPKRLFVISVIFPRYHCMLLILLLHTTHPFKLYHVFGALLLPLSVGFS